MRAQSSTKALTARAVAGTLVAALGCVQPGQAAEPGPVEPTTIPRVGDSRVRTDHPVLATLIERAALQSATVRALMERIHRTNGIVYVLLGRCGRSVQACLPYTMTLAGDSRILKVIVGRLEPDADAIASIAHELQHAVEVLEEPAIRTGASMYLYYLSNGSKRGDVFETPAAVAVGRITRQEIGKLQSGRVLRSGRASNGGGGEGQE